MEETDSPLIINGVVYNEMKGAFFLTGKRAGPVYKGGSLSGYLIPP